MLPRGGAATREPSRLAAPARYGWVGPAAAIRSGQQLWPSGHAAAQWEQSVRRMCGCNCASCPACASACSTHPRSFPAHQLTAPHPPAPAGPQRAQLPRLPQVCEEEPARGPAGAARWADVQWRQVAGRAVPVQRALHCSSMQAPAWSAHVGPPPLLFSCKSLQRGLLVNDTIVIRYQIELVVSSGGALSRSTSKPPVPQVRFTGTGCVVVCLGAVSVSVPKTPLQQAHSSFAQHPCAPAAPES